MTEAVDRQTGQRFRVLFFATHVSDRNKPERVVVYAGENRMDKVLVRDETEFNRMYEIK